MASRGTRATSSVPTRCRFAFLPPWFLLLLLCFLGGCTTFCQAQQLDPRLFSIFTVDPAEPRWPVVIAAMHNGSTIPWGSVIWTWAFPGQADQSCTSSGRVKVLPCRGMVVEKAWTVSGTYSVTLSAALPGMPAVVKTKSVNVASFTGTVVLRQEVRSLHPSRWNQIVSALQQMKAIGVYDHFVYTHQVAAFTGMRAGSNRNAAHRGPAFLPWHRVFLRHFERALQIVAGDQSVGLAYWDWTIDQALPAGPLTSPIWNNTFLGPNGVAANNYAVPSGAFCSIASPTCAGLWPILTQLGGPYLERELGRLARRLPSSLEVSHIQTVATYDANPYDDHAVAAGSYRQALEGWAGGTVYGQAHNGVHSFIGGSMGPMTSPNDPAFFLHHCNVDRLWYLWQVQRNCYNGCYRPWTADPSVTQATPGAQLAGGVWRIPGHHWGDMMFPWSVAPSDVADVDNSLRGYVYL